MLLVSLTASLMVFLGSSFARSTLYGRADQPSRAWVITPVHGVECVGSRCYRWTEPDARMYLYALDGGHALLSLRMLAPQRAGTQPSQLTITANALAPMPIMVATDWRDYHLLLPSSAARDTVLQLHSAGFQPSAHDQRQLGIALVSLQLTALGSLTPERALFLLALPLLGWALAWACGVGPRGAVLIGVVLAALSGWAAFDRVASGYLLPTVSLTSRQIVPLLALLVVPPLIHWRTGRLLGGSASVVAIIGVVLLSLRLTREIAGGLTLLLLGFLLLVRPPSATIRRDHIRTVVQPHIAELTSIRFIAAMAVVLFHYHHLFEPFLPPLLNPLFAHGRVSVGLFFVLSGFVMTYTYAAWFQDDLARFRDYLRARIVRLVPLTVLALLLATPLVLNYSLGHPFNTDLANLLDRSWIANLLLVHVYVPDDWFHSLWNAASWSVGGELFFYLMFPLYARLVLSRVTRLRALVSIALVCFGLESLTLVASIVVAHQIIPDPETFTRILNFGIYRSPLLRIWEFLLGATLGALFLHMRQQPVATLGSVLLQRTSGRNLLLVTALGGILAVTYVPTPAGAMAEMIDALRWYALYTPFFALLIAALAWGPTWASPILRHPWLVYLGEASYALYILHEVGHNYILINLQATEAANARLGLMAVVGSLLSALVVHQWVEIPARRWLAAGLTSSVGLRQRRPPGG